MNQPTSLSLVEREDGNGVAMSLGAMWMNECKRFIPDDKCWSLLPSSCLVS